MIILRAIQAAMRSILILIVPRRKEKKEIYVPSNSRSGVSLAEASVVGVFPRGNI